MKRVAILGSTGSIGRSTLSVVESFPDRFQVVTLAAGRNLELAFEQAQRWRPRVISVSAESHAQNLKSRLKSAGITDIEVTHGAAGNAVVATHPEVDFVVSAIVGVAGLEATYEAVRAGKTVGLANKECLVAAGERITAEARRQGEAAASDRQRTQCRPPVPARGAYGGSAAHLAHCFRWAIPTYAEIQICRYYGGAGFEPPHLENGQPDHH